MFQMMKFASLLFPIERGLNFKAFIVCARSYLSTALCSILQLEMHTTRNADSRTFCLLSGSGDDGNIYASLL